MYSEPLLGRQRIDVMKDRQNGASLLSGESGDTPNSQISTREDRSASAFDDTTTIAAAAHAQDSATPVR